MPRSGRTVLPYYPHHIVQRGHNRQVVFAEARDFERYLETLAEFKAGYGVKVYAYCLMTNHVHLLLAPETMAGLAQLMKRLAGRQTRYHNRLEGRSGTLWESRYKSSLVDSDVYLLACSRYIELNPVRALLGTHTFSTPRTATFITAAAPLRALIDCAPTAPVTRSPAPAGKATAATAGRRQRRNCSFRRDLPSRLTARCT